MAIWPVLRDGESVFLCIENEDDEGIEHHLRRIVDRVNEAARKHRELTALKASPPVAAVHVGSEGLATSKVDKERAA